MTDRPPHPADREPSLRRFARGALHALELLREGRISAPYAAAHDVADEGPHHRLRRYRRPPGVEAVGAPLLLVPPLMVTAEIYDISPELSAAAWLSAQGVDVWIVDFGRPEDITGGMDRTLDDHVLAVDAALTFAGARSGGPVHVGGYSQGGMFAYQAAAYRRSEGVASVIAFGSPVDLARNLPVKVHSDLAGRAMRAAAGALSGPLSDLDGLPGSLTSRGFKLMNPAKEVKQLLGLFNLLPDRDALARREPKRRFLGGEGFVGWPGPAFRTFVDDFVAGNRMRRGGFVIGGRATTLADITCPILYFVGLDDDMARPASVRAIVRAAPRAEAHEVTLRAGHFGLVVGSRAMARTWPTVHEWVAWRAGAGPTPTALEAPPEASATPSAPAAPEPTAVDAPVVREAAVPRLYDVATEIVDGLWHRLGEASLEVAGILDAVRWQLPRLARLESLAPHTRISVGRALADQAAAIGDATFFMWGGRAFTYAEAHQRVDAVAAALLDAGVTRGDHVAVLMGNHPDFLTTVAAVSRIGGVAVLPNAAARGSSLTQALVAGETDVLVADPARIGAAAEAFATGPLLLLGAEREGVSTPGRALDLDAAIDAGAPLPPRFQPDPGLSGDLAMLLFTSGTTGLPKAARITNRRWAVAALGAAAACRMSPQDTVYCCLPLHHATGLLVGVGAALVGGARLALAPRFSASTFWNDIRRYGATVVFYVGELCRYLVGAPPAEAESEHPVRLFIGNGMRPHVWRSLLDRFGPLDVLEFYGSTEGNVVLANLTGEKVGSVGRPVVGGGDAILVRYDVTAERLERGDDGRLLRCDDDEPGMLVARIRPDHPLAHFDGYVSAQDTEAKIVRDAFVAGDAWFVTGDLLRRDAEGDYWFVDRVGDTYRWKGENVSTEQVAAVVGSAAWIRMQAVYGVALLGREGRAGMVAVELQPGASFDGVDLYQRVAGHLFPAARPRFVRVVEALEMTGSLKVVKHGLQRDGADPARVTDALYFLDEDSGAYRPLDAAGYATLVAAS